MTRRLGVSRHSAPLDWWETEDAHDEIADLIAYLTDRAQLNSIDDVLYVIRKPWKYTIERDAMQKARRAA